MNTLSSLILLLDHLHYFVPLIFKSLHLPDNNCVPEGHQECPGGWWGAKKGACGPCSCTASGLHPHCDARTGECRCKVGIEIKCHIIYLLLLGGYNTYVKYNNN